MTCSCGDTMSMDAESRDEAVGKFKAMMTEDAIKAHWAEKHAGSTDPMPSVADCHAMIDQTVEPPRRLCE